MDMRVIIHLARVGMQNRDGTGRTPQLLVVLGERAHSLPTTTYEQVVDDALVRTSQPPEFRRQGKSQQKVFGWYLFLQLPFQPLLAFVVLAVRAVAMAAGVRHQDLMLAPRALHLHLGAGLRAAVSHGRQRPRVVGREFVAVLREEVGREGFDDGSEQDHLTSLQPMAKPSIKPLMCSMA